MNLLPTQVIEINQTKINHIDSLVKSIYPLIIYSRHHFDDGLLYTCMNSIQNLTRQLAIKNAQMDAQNEVEAKEYLKNLQHSVESIIEEINSNNNFESEQ